VRKTIYKKEKLVPLCTGVCGEILMAGEKEKDFMPVRAKTH